MKKLKLPNVPVILRGWIKAAFLRYCWHHELTGTAYDPEQMAKGIMIERLNIAESGGMEMITRADPENPFRVLLDSFARFALLDAPNYREFNMTWLATEKGGEDLPVIVTVQRRLGLSPHEARQKAERSLAAAEHAKRELLAALEAYEQQVQRLEAEKEANRKTIDDLEAARQRANALMSEGSAKIEELRAERDEHARIAAGLAIDLGECRAAREKLSNTMLATCQANGELGTATVEALCRIDALEDLIQHWHVYLNYRGAAPEKLTEQQRELFAEVWRKHNEKVDAEEAAGK